jgi:hypothetical protein
MFHVTEISRKAPKMIRNRRRTNPFEKEGVWEEYMATQTGEKYLDGRVQIEYFEGTFPSGEVRKGLTIRAFDEQSQQWSIRLNQPSRASFSPSESIRTRVLVK